MITHYIIMSSSYSNGTRIALHYIMKKEKYAELKEIIPRIIRECGRDVSVSTHFIQTDSELWSSVVEKDHFFRNVDVIDTIEDFIALIKKDRVLKGIDVAKYILAKVKCTHLKLEKLVYMCFADYLCKYDKELFTDKIFAYKYGPVVESVYEKYKNLEKGDKDIDEIVTDEMPSRSRILFAEGGIEKMSSIDNTLAKYGKLSAKELVDITHRENTPWSLSGKGEYNNKVIKNEIIKQYHYLESV